MKGIQQMETENTLAKIIDSAGEKASYDAACKRLLANKIILAWIMKSCIEEYKDCDVNEIAEKYIEGNPQVSQVAVHPDEEVNDVEQIVGVSTEDSRIKEGMITYDVRFFAVAPISGEFIKLIINVEAQNDFYPGYPIPKRAIYYCSRMISAQYGTEFTDARYDKVKKVFSIWICLNPSKEKGNSITKYSIKEENLVGNVKEKVTNYDLMTAIIICLGEPDKDNYSGILKLLEVLLSSEREAEEKKKILKNDFSIVMTKALEREVSLMCNLSKGVEEKGIQKGIQQGIISSIKNLMESMGWSVEQAMNALKIPELERQNYMNELKQK
jgi:hypothetical protein